MSSLGDVAKVHHGWPFRSVEAGPARPAEPRLIRIGNFAGSRGAVFNRSATESYRGQYPTAFNLKPGDLLIAMTCQTPGGEILGWPMRVPSDELKYLHNQRIGRVEVTDAARVSIDYLEYLFRTDDFNHYLATTASGSKILHTAPSRIEAYQVELPPLEEQQRIAGVLAALDELIYTNTSTIGGIRELAVSEFQRLLSDESVEVRLGDIVTVNGRVKKPENRAITYLDIAALNDGSIEWPENVIDWKSGPSRARRLAVSGSVLWATVRPNRRAHALLTNSRPDLVVSTGIAVLEPRSIGPAELFAVTDTEQFVSHLVARAEGSAYPAVNGAAFEDAFVTRLVPECAEAYEERFWPLWVMAGELETENAQLRRTRDELLPLLMSGKVRVGDINGVGVEGDE